MWLATSFGFLMPAIRPPKTVKPGDDRTLQVRARRSQDLDILRAEFMKGKLGPTLHTPTFDYEYRAYCTPEAFAFAMAEMIREIDYTKFKPTTDRYEDDELHNVYNQMWGVLLRGLSSKYHQSYYWNYHPDGKASSDAGAKKPATSAYRGTGAGYPPTKALGSPATDIDTVLGEYDRYQQWFADADQRNTAADRDDDARVPEVVDVEWKDDMPEAPKSVLEAVDKLEDEIAAILAAGRNPIDHSQCPHGDTPNSKAKCRARHRRAEMKRVAELRGEIERAWDDAAKDHAADANTSDNPDADPETWRGYVWEGHSADKQYAL